MRRRKRKLGKEKDWSIIEDFGSITLVAVGMLSGIVVTAMLTPRQNCEPDNGKEK